MVYSGLMQRFLFTLIWFLSVAAFAATPLEITKVTSVAAPANGHQLLKEPGAIAVDLPGGALYVTDRGHHQVVRIDPSGVIVPIAGTGKPGRADGPGVAAELKEPQGIALDTARRLIYVADTGNHVIRRITLNTGLVETFAGAGRPEDRDGLGTQAGFKEPAGLAIDQDGNLYVADSGNDKIRRISPSGNVTTFAGSGRPGFGNGAVLQALFRSPRGVAVSRSGVVYVADTQNHAIRKIANGVVSTFAGTTHGGATDGGPSVAEFKEPSGIALDEAGDLWIADTKNHQIRRVNAAGETSTVAGDGKPGYVDGNTPLAAAFHEPSRIAVAGAVFVADSKNDAVRILVPALTATDLQPRRGTPEGGDVVRVLGTGFIPGRTTVTFGGVAAASIIWVSSTELSVVTPARPIGDAEVRISTAAGNMTLPFLFRFDVPFVSLAVAPVTAVLDVGSIQQFTATGSGADHSTVDLTSRVTWSSGNPSIVTIDASGLARAIAAGTTTISATFGSLSSVASVATRQPQTLPPDPASVATQFDPTVVSDMSSGVQFLYTGTRPVQKDVAAGAINVRRVAVIRGRVRAADGSPLPGVRVSILGNPQFGFTLTRGDGMYDIAVSGGGFVTLRFEKAGSITAQRRTATPWRDYVVLDDLYMSGYDDKATVVEMAAAVMQVAQGSVVTDDDGQRRATLLIPAGTTATIQTASGSQPAPSLTIRATEFSVGVNGPKLMPGALPPASAYTYCVELSSDEAVALNAAEVTFSKALAFYVDNFLNFPVGTVVPAGYYDRAKGAWIASENGVVLKVLTTDGGTATIDTSGDGVADDAIALGMTAEELQMLAAHFEPGQTFWRAPITHFTPWDLNYPPTPPDGAAAPHQPQPTWFRGIEDPQTRCGSTIDCQNQVFGEAIAIEGTPFALQYQSDHAPGYKPGYTVEIPISGAVVPAPLKRIDVEVRIQGRLFSRSFPAAPDQTYRFTWDGLDAYGRAMQGLQIARIRVGYVYDGIYAEPAARERAFAMFSGTPITTNPILRQQLTFWQDEQALVGGLDDLPLGFGAWTMSAVKTLEPASGVIHGGAAAQRTGDLQRSIIDRFAGGGDGFGNGDGGLARDASFQQAGAVAVGPDGAVYVSDSGTRTIRRIGPDGVITTLITNTGFTNIMAIGPDGALYYVLGAQIWRTDPATRVRTLFAGTTTFSSIDVDGIPAINAYLGVIENIAFTPDGSLYVAADTRIRRIGADGIIYGVTGPSTLPSSPDPEGRPALRTNIGAVLGFTAAVDGTLYFTVVPHTGRVFAISLDGTIRRFAGSGISDRYEGDGGPALGASIAAPSAMVTGPDGSVYISDTLNATIRRVLPNGIIKTIAGFPRVYGGAGDGGPATAAALSVNARYFAVGPDNTAYVSDQFQNYVRRISPPDPATISGEYSVPSADGGAVDIFSSLGRHLRSTNSVTGVVTWQFGYDPSHRLVKITDAYGNITTIERNAAGAAAAIVSPFGKRTTLVIGDDGYLKAVENPAGERTEMTYEAGQLTSMKNARRIVKTIFYDADGRLLREQLADGGGIKLTRAGTERDAIVTVESGEGVATRHDRRLDDAARDTRVDRDTVTGLQTTTLRTDDGASTTTLADGTIVTAGVRGDPRFKTLAPLPFGSVRTPAGRMLSAAVQRSVTLSNESDPLSLTSLTETLDVNGRAWTSTFTRATGAVTTVTPAGRQSTATLNAKGDITSMQVPGLASTSVTYDPQGRMTTVGAGARTYGIAYNSRGEVERITDPLLRTVSFEYDDAGRVKRQTFPDTRSVDFNYDENGNLISVAPPARTAHSFGYTVRDQVERYTPPTAAPGGVTQYLYNRDRQLTGITRPDGSTIIPGYDVSGRISTMTAPSGTYRYQYSPATGHPVSVGAPGGEELTYAYDGSLLTNVEWTGTVSGSVSYDYDDDLRLSGENGTSYQYDADDLLIGAGALALTRNPQNGLLTGTVLGAVRDSYTYNEFGEVARYASTVGTSTLLAIDYGRDASGRITSTSETARDVASPSRSYEYDRAGRLTRVTRAGTAAAEYDYDPNGNRLAHRFTGGAAAALYDQQDRLLTYDDTAYAYSANGELRSSTTAGETTNFDYDALGNLRSVEMRGRRIDYVIDGQNRRIGKKVDGALVQGWLYGDQLRVVAELDGVGAVVSRFVYASRANAPDYMVRAGVTYRIITDHLGTPRMIVNAADGTIAQQMEFDEFGRVLSDTNPSFQPFGFAGGLYDRDTGFVRFGARDYDPRTGRWTTRDPIGFGGRSGNLYEYVNSAPVDSIDPSGLSGKITIYSSFSNGSSAPTWAGHSWIVFTPDGGVPASYGTFGFGVEAPRGLNTNWEIDHWQNYADRGKYDVTSRTRWIDDAHEAALMAIIHSYQNQDDQAWTSSKTCSTFARDAWRSATGESLTVKKKSDSYPNPQTLMDSLRAMNGGLDARVVMRKR